MQLKKLLSSAVLLAAATAQQAENLTSVLTSNDDLSSLVALLSRYPDLATSLGSAQNVTLLAPSNDAIDALTSSGMLTSASEDAVSALLGYHVLAGTVLSSNITETPLFAHTTLNDTAYSNVTDGQVVAAVLNGKDVDIVSGLKAVSTVTTPDLTYTGGVVHVIDKVLTIPLNITTTAVAADLTTLAGGLILTNLLNTLETLTDVTIFAPSNDAFTAAGSQIADLSVFQLASILNYHVINGTTLYSSSLVSGNVDTLLGDPVKVTVEDGGIFINEARVINPDILTSGGVIHIIDSVLNPNNTGTPNPNAQQPAVQFAGASSAAVGSIASAVPQPSTTIAALVATTENVAQGYTTKEATVAPGKKTKSSSQMAAVQTGMVGAAALFGGAAMLANW